METTLSSLFESGCTGIASTVLYKVCHATPNGCQTTMLYVHTFTNHSKFKSTTKQMQEQGDITLIQTTLNILSLQIQANK